MINNSEYDSHEELISVWLAIKTGIKNMLYSLRAVMYHHDKLEGTDFK
jgi:hypothetical protein